MEVKKLPKEEFKFIYDRVPRLCVDLIIRNEKKGILLIERDINPGKGLWHFPGGTVLKGESLLQAMRRIAKEETNLEVIKASIVGMMDFYQEANPYFHTVSAVFEVETKRGDISGSFQGENLQYHNTIPAKIIPEQKQFIIDNKLLI